MVSAIALANTILKRAFKENIPVTPMKLQKLIYFVYRQFLQDYGKQILSDNFLVWQYGPVLQSVYDEFKSFRANQITRFAKDAKNNVYIVNESINKELSSVITDVWDKYKQYSGIYLSELTHRPGSAWRKARERNDEILSIEDLKNEIAC